MIQDKANKIQQKIGSSYRSTSDPVKLEKQKEDVEIFKKNCKELLESFQERLLNPRPATSEKRPIDLAFEPVQA